jgi:hypothetical protein
LELQLELGTSSSTSSYSCTLGTLQGALHTNFAKQFPLIRLLVGLAIACFPFFLALTLTLTLSASRAWPPPSCSKTLPSAPPLARKDLCPSSRCCCAQWPRWTPCTPPTSPRTLPKHPASAALELVTGLRIVPTTLACGAEDSATRFLGALACLQGYRVPLRAL